MKMKPRKLAKETYLRWAWKDADGQFYRFPSGRIAFTEGTREVAQSQCRGSQKPIRVRVTIEEI